MEQLSIVSNIILVILTGIYVWFTFRLLKEQKRMGQEAITNQSETARITLMPILFVNFDSISRGIYNFNITNSGDNPAFDLDILMVGSNWIMENNTESFWASKKYGLLPNGYEIVGKFGFVKPEKIFIYLIYFDHLGNQYNQEFSFWKKEDYFRLADTNTIVKKVKSQSETYENSTAIKGEMSQNSSRCFKEFDLKGNFVQLDSISAKPVKSEEELWEIQKKT